MENGIICMKSLEAPNLKTIVLTKVMYTMIHSDDEQAFNMSEESGKKTIVKKSLRPVSLESMVY